MSELIYNIRLTSEQMNMVRDTVEYFRMEYGYGMSEDEKGKWKVLFEVLGIEDERD